MPTRSREKNGWRHTGKRTALFLLLALTVLFLSNCQVWNSRKAVTSLQKDIRQAEDSGMKEGALYHLAAAKELLDAALVQYEEADFTSAYQFALQANEQLERAREIHALQQHADIFRSRSMP